jgi:membrane protein
VRLRLPRILRELVEELGVDKVGRLAAALAYFAMFAMPGLLLFVTSLAGALYGFDAVERALRAQMGGLTGESGSQILKDMLEHANPLGRGTWHAKSLAAAGVLLGATGFLVQFEDALDSMWGAEARPRGGWVPLVVRRIVSLGMIGTVALLLVASLTLSAALAAAGHRLGIGGEEAPWAVVANALVTTGALTVLFAAVFKWMPRLKIEWREVWIGALVTSVLVVAGKEAIGLYLGKSDPGAAFGAMGPLAVLLSWLYYFTLIVLVGAEFTQVYARLYGPRRAERTRRMESPPRPAPKRTTRRRRARHPARGGHGAP